MGLDDQLGRDSDSIRRWLAQRATYASEEVRLRVDPEVRGDAAPEYIDDDPADVEVAVAVPDAVDAGAAVVAALREDARQETTPSPRTTRREPEPPSVPLHEPPPRPVRRRTLRQREQLSDATYAARSTNVVFAPRSAIRHFLTLLVLVMLAGAIAAGYFAFVERTQTTIVAAAALATLALVVWGARAAAVPTVVLLKRGQLEIRRGGRLDTADLANARTPIAVVGRPSSRRWRVLIERPDAPLLVIDPTMVDPESFTEVLFHVHPQLWSEPGAMLEPWQVR